MSYILPPPQPQGVGFKPGADERRNKGGRPKLDRNARGYLDAKTKPALRKLWKLTDNADPGIALTALVAFLRKCIPDLKAVAHQGTVSTAPALGNLTPEDLTELAKMRRELEAKVAAATDADPH